MKNKLAATKNFVMRRKVAIAVVTTATVCFVANRKALEMHNEFLKAHDLFDEFYNSVD